MAKTTRTSEVAAIIRRYFNVLYKPHLASKIPGMEVLKYLQIASGKVGDVWLNYLDVGYDTQTCVPVDPKTPLVSVDLRSTADRQTSPHRPDNITPTADDSFFRYMAYTGVVGLSEVKTREEALLEIEFYEAVDRAYKRGWPFALFVIELRSYLASQRTYRFHKDGECWTLTLSTPDVVGHYVLTFRFLDVRDLQHLNLSD